jgi:hypothetical protein
VAETTVWGQKRPLESINSSHIDLGINDRPSQLRQDASRKSTGPANAESKLKAGCRRAKLRLEPRLTTMILKPSSVLWALLCTLLAFAALSDAAGAAPPPSRPQNQNPSRPQNQNPSRPQNPSRAKPIPKLPKLPREEGISDDDASVFSLGSYKADEDNERVLFESTFHTSCPRKCNILS